MKILGDIKKLNFFQRFKIFIDGATLLYRLHQSTNAPMWFKAESYLTDYNNTVITLSSSALVLSFSIVKIGKIFPNKYLLGFSWILFISVIVLAVIILFISFLHSLAGGNIERLQNNKEWKKEMMWEKPEVSFYWTARKIMFWLSIVELIAFVFALVILMLCAYLIV